MNWFSKTVLSKRFWMSRRKFEDKPSTLTVSVVIPAWNEEETIAATIRSVQAQTYPCTIIVVNDRSTDKTEEIANSFVGVHVITVTEKAGSKSQALNKAIPYLETDLFICVDADTRLETDSVDKLIRAFNNPNVAVACGFVSSAGRDTFWQKARFGEYIIGQSLIKGAQENMNSVMVASGCFLAMRTEFLRKHGFDDRSMAEDMDLTWIAIEQGYDVAFVDNAKCEVTDPHTWYLYHKQVYRWYAGMFQCIRARKFDLFTKNPQLGIVVYLYMFITLTGLPTTLFLFGMILMYTSPLFVLPVIAILYFSMFVVAYTYGRTTKDGTHGYARYVLASMALAYINYVIFLSALVNELILNRRLKNWVKGH